MTQTCALLSSDLDCVCVFVMGMLYSVKETKTCTAVWWCLKLFWEMLIGLFNYIYGNHHLTHRLFSDECM